ncbi:hypothetical protein [Leptolyngbya sp. FACHB-261]|uniref:hypothetical protein n=1 Tax=Leptolyngbya sp. FACHB-261 TaxID=2692806 RepID=UPI0016893194|nr:hypothetical protein [Leptolyngbya sp. FACHB-261]MBD2103354.1 hypothetical protein [Leptolyngbya sp. FACHB-261]
MLKLLGRLLLWFRGGSLKLLFFASLILLAWGTFSPIGTITWWLRYGSEAAGLKRAPAKRLPGYETGGKNQSANQVRKIDCYVVFLTGVGDFSADQLTPGETFFLNHLEQAHPNCVTVRDVFPYSAANKSLGGERLLSPLWQFADKAEGWLGVANVLIKIRNLWRLAISADPRYGPIYNQGIAKAIIERMQAAHALPAAQTEPFQIILIGTSGGAQVALGAASYLAEQFETQITVISVGGVFSGNNGFDAAQHTYHLQGQRDWIDDLGIVFPSRWPWVVASPYNQAHRQGRYSVESTGPHAHDGAQGYFGLSQVGAEKATYVNLTLRKINQFPVWSAQEQGGS